MVEQAEILEHVFKTERLIDVDEGIESAAIRVMTTIWDRHIGTPETFHLTFCSHLLANDREERIDPPAIYTPVTDTITIAVGRAQEIWRNGGLPPKATVILTTAHEAAHKMQYRRDGLVSGQIIDLAGLEYEAWDEALHVFKKEFPRSSGRLVIDETTSYSLPDVSRYQ